MPDPRVGIAVAVLDTTDKITFVSAGLATLFERSVENQVGCNFYQLLTGTAQSPEIRQPERPAKGIASVSAEIHSEALDARLHLTVFPMADTDGRPMGSVAVIEDASAARRAEDEQRQTREQYRRILEAANASVWILDSAQCFRFANRDFARLLGYTPEELQGRRIEEFVFADDLDDHRRQMACCQRGRAARYERHWCHKDGHEVWTAVSAEPLRNEHGHINGSFAVITDISDRKETKDLFSSGLHFFGRLCEAIPTPIFYQDTDGRYVSSNTAFADLFDRPKEEIPGKTIFEIAPTDVAKRIADIDHELFKNPDAPQMAEVRVPTQTRGCRAVVFHKTVFRDDAAGGVAGLVGACLDVTEMRQAQAESIADSVQLHLTLKAAHAALGEAVELRDPYTAGHQRRVAKLACAIATELGWQQGDIDTLRSAAMLHDIGKIVVPAEILSKPGTLNEAEQMLVSDHARVGAKVIAAMDIDGIVATIVAQHHERLDGSGYPAGLSGDEIIAGARVVAVADVVEAMVSHRPYRPALPLESAIAELEDGSGTRYDAEICVACARLLRERGVALLESDWESTVAS